MPPKKGNKGKKGKKKGPPEPAHDSGWEKRRIDFRGAKNLSKVVISPSTMLPKLQVMDLSCCKSLEYLLIQCDSLETLSLHRCIALKKVILYTSHLKDINFHECKEISTLILWSEKLCNLDLHSPKLAVLQLFCPNLLNFKEPPLKPTTPPVNHPTINTILEVDLERKKHEQLEKDVRLLNDMDYKPYSSSPILPQTCFLGF